MATKYRDLIKQVTGAGWVLHHSRGSHLHFRHPSRPGIVTVPAGGKMNNDVPPGTLNSVLKQAGLK
jgi:predicted RNA binding protein YcfA (HicA-like mRNA interferase family)